MAINYNNDPYNQGLGNLDIGNMQTAGLLPEFMGGTSDAEDAAQDSLEQIQNLRQQENAIKSMGEGAIELKQDELKSIQNQIQNIKNQNKDFQEFKDIGGLTANANNIMSDANYVYSDVPELSSGIMQMLNKQQNYEPQYRIRDQLNRDFLQGGLFRDAKQSLGDTYNQLRQSPLGQGIGSIRNFATSMKDKGIDLGKMAMSGIGNMIMPGLGFVLSNLPKDSASNKFNRSFTVGGANMPNDPYGYYGALRAGNLNQDPFGRNPVSAFGNYMGTLAKDANYLGTNKFNLAKQNFAQNYFDKNAVNAGGVKIDNTVYSGADYQGGDGPSNAGGFDTSAADRAGTSAGSGQFSSKSSKGRQGYGRGGIASLWQR
jgi:hypothetical protein